MKPLSVQLKVVAVVSGLWLSMAGIGFGQATISTVAGTGIAGFDPNDDGGPAVQAELTAPYGVFVDTGGNLFIADQVNFRIRKVDTGGAITTVAGAGGPFTGDFRDNQPATTAYLNSPRSVCVDKAGNIYISDWLNHRIRKVGTNGIITTFAGSGPYGPNQGGYGGDHGPAAQARLNYPVGICLDQVGNLYIADSANHRVRKVDTNGNISTVAGTGTAGYSGDGLQAVNAELRDPSDVFVHGNNLYIADSDNNVVRKVDLLTGIISTFAGHGPGAQDFNNPTGVAVDNDGSVYVSDELNSRVRKVDINGIITTIVGTGAQGYSGDGGPPENAQLNMPSDVAVDAFGTLYISDWMANVVRRVGTRGRLDLEINQGYVLDNGLGESQMKVRLLDSRGQLLSADNGTSVSFAVTQGFALISGPNPARSSGGVVMGNTVGKTNAKGIVVVQATAAGFTADRDTIFVVYGPGRRLRLTISQPYILANGTDESQMSAELLDQDNQVIFTEDRTQVRFTVSGPASVLGANPVTVQRGVALSTLRSQTQEGWAVVTATADGFATITASVMVKAANQPPVADAGADQTLECLGEPVEVVLDGRGSSDPDGDALTYTWSGPFGTAAGPNPAVDLALGSQTITLQVTDSHGTSATDQVVINVVDTTPPVVSLNGAATVIVECHLGTYTELGATALDACDGNLPVATSGSVDVTTVGTYTLSYTATDHSHNAGNMVRRTVNVVDTIAPVVSVPADMSVEATGPQTTVSIGTATATDAVGVMTLTSNAPATFPLGTTTVTWTATDKAGNTGTATQLVLVKDSTAPVVTAALTAISRDRDEDEDGNFYRITATATDAVDTHPVVSALITQPLTSSTNMVVSYKREKKNRIQVKIEKRKLQVQLEGPSEAALRALWSQVLSAGGFSVSDGQTVQLVLKKDKDEYEAHYQFDKTLKLTSAKGPGLKLAVQASDALGNQSPRVEVAPGKRAKSGREGGEGGDHRDAKLVSEGSLPANFGLEANYPNPFNPTTTLRYNLVEAGQVQLTIYNVMGQQIRVLVDQAQEAGAYQLEWNNLDEAGQAVAPGLYLYRLVSGNQTAVGKMLLVK